MEKSIISKRQEPGEGAIELAVVAGFVAVDEFERTGCVAEGLEGEGGLGGGVDGFVLFGDLVIESGLFHAPDAHLAPAGNGHGLNERVLDGAFGREFGAELREKAIEAGPVFAVENDTTGEQPVTQTIA